ncbi:uncharacterized protein LOC135367370 [Ornithodoros turicata]|uniref:uncharacterized protein LOC135367370 n=1 Tax=Ornithodoros turicata TaxID=34597 RepID=UPI003139B16E
MPHVSLTIAIAGAAAQPVYFENRKLHFEIYFCRQGTHNGGTMKYTVDIIKEGYSYLEGKYMKANGTCTLIRGGGINVIVDTLSAWDRDFLSDSLSKRGLSCADINFVVCTHGHSDHVGNLNLFQTATHIVGRCVSKGDAYQLDAFEKDGPFRIAEDLQVILTPGHTLSDVSVLVATLELGIVAITGWSLVECLRLIDIHVPGAVRSGDPVQLQCEYNLEGAELYSVKWYKNNVEFYRYLPSDIPPGQSYELLGISVDHSRSDKNKVFLEKTDLNTEGMYGCEVSTESPGYRTVKGERELRVYVLPEEGPIMEGFQSRYQVGDQVNVTCYSRPSKPMAQLKWHVNGKEVPAKYETRSGVIRHENGLQSSSATLHLQVRPEHVQRGSIRFRCVSAVTQAHSRSSEELVIGEKAPGPVLQESNSPRIMSAKSKYEVGDDVDVNCTSVVTVHPVQLRWFVNDKEANASDLLRFANVRYPDGTEAAVLGLRFRATSRHLSDSEGLRLKCTATQSRVVALSSEETVQGAHQRSSGLAADSSGSVRNRVQWCGAAMALLLTTFL